MKEQTHWERHVPWFLTIASSIVLIAIGYFLINNINWFKEGAFANKADLNLEYKVYAYQMHLSMIKRSVGLFSGFAVLFLGTGVVFYSLKQETTVDLSGGGITAKIISASPGIVAMILGAFLIMNTINSKDDFPVFEDVQQSERQIKKPVNSPGRVN